MNKLTFKDLYLFDSDNTKAKHVHFEKGINVISSSGIDGNQVGKSTIMKSLYHALGADSNYNSKWREDIAYLLIFEVNNMQYAIYRKRTLFRVYDSKKEQILLTADRKELNKTLSKIFNFRVQLPNKENSLELTSPAFSYMLNYIDQDYMRGTVFASFKNSSDFPLNQNNKLNIIFNHLGVFDPKYFNLEIERDKLKLEKSKLERTQAITSSMIKKINGMLEGFDVPMDTNALNLELEKHRKEYFEIITKLSKVKNQLIKLRNLKEDMFSMLNELRKQEKKGVSGIEKIKDNHCPLCDNTVEHKIKHDLILIKTNSLEDILLLKVELEGDLKSIDSQIKNEEIEYKSHLDLLEKYKHVINSAFTESKNVLKNISYNETRDSLFLDQNETNTKLANVKENIAEKVKLIKDFANLKNDINKRYYQYMTEAIDHFGLDISDDKISKIESNITPTGSDVASVSILWVITLLKLKHLFNSEAIAFPLVIDSPNNVESDEVKSNTLLKYIFDYQKKSQEQLIISSLGFTESDAKENNIDNYIYLSNKKHNLLNEEDYHNNIEFFQSIVK